MSRVIIAIPSHHRRGLLTQCVRHLRKKYRADAKLFVVGSETYTPIDEAYVYVQNNKYDQGMAYAACASWAMDSDLRDQYLGRAWDYLLIVEDDCIIGKDCVEYLQAALDDNKSVGMVTPFARYANIFAPKKKKEIITNTPIEVTTFFGAVMIRRKCFERIGNFTPCPSRSEVDMAIRLRLAGWKTCGIPAAYAEHNRVEFGGIHHKFGGRRFPSLRARRKELAKGWRPALNRRFGCYSWFHIDQYNRLQIEWARLSNLKPETKNRIIHRLRNPFISALYEGQSLHIPMGKALTDT